jgi:hypothetical protein
MEHHLPWNAAKETLSPSSFDRRGAATAVAREGGGRGGRVTISLPVVKSKRSYESV